MLTILVIDDDPVIQFLLKRILSAQGYEIVLANDGESGVELANQLCPALIICDWMLPGIDGLEVCRRIRLNPNLASSFLILLTSRDTTSDVVQGLDTGADEFLSKPIEQSELKARVRAGLRLYQANQLLQTQKRILENELAEAANYVQMLLPKPVDLPIQIDSRYIPSRQLGGDCFDYFWLDQDFLAFYLLDTSGHGIGSALLSISVLNLIRSQSLDEVNFYQPSSVLTKLNRDFQMSQQGFKYFTIWYGVYDLPNHQLVYAGAGHPPALLLSNGDKDKRIIQLKSKGVPIGFFADSSFDNIHYKVEPNSELYIFSDGVYEFKQRDGKMLGLNGLVSLINQLHQSSSLSLDNLLSNVQSLNPESGYEDDISLLKVGFP